MAEILIVALVIAGWVVMYLSSRRELKRACASLRLGLQRQIDSLSQKLSAFERSPSGRVDGLEASEEITADTLAAIAKTITGLLGRKVRIRSVKILQTSNTVASQWAQQGRVVVQASHDLAQRGREV